MSENKIKAAIFDYDGTIMDSMVMWRTASSNFVRTVLGREPAEDLDRVIRNLSLEEGASIFRDEYGASGTDEEIVDAVLETVTDQYRYSLQLKDGILEVLDDLRAHGVRICIATASTREMIESANERLGISHYFDEVFTCSEVGASKRFPMIYDLAASFMGASEEETLVFEDVLYASQTASAAGYQLVGIYDIMADDEKEEIKKTAKLYLENWKEWPGIENFPADN